MSSVETFSAGTYEITLYAEFAGYADKNNLSYYEVNTSVFTVIFTGPEGGSDYIDPPVTKSFTADYQFGLSMVSKGNHTYFTETSRNGDGIQHAKVYENLDDPGMFLIGFENQWQGGDKDFNDMVFSLKPIKQPPVASFDYSPSYPSINETVTFNASASYDPDGNITSYRWDFGDGNITTVSAPIITHVYTSGNSTINYTVTLTVTDNDGLTNSTTDTVNVINPAILRVSLPAGTYVWSNPDKWLRYSWVLNITGVSGTFTVKIEDTSGCIWSYDTHLITALNDAAYNNLVNLTVDGTTLVQADFKNGTPEPYNLGWTWPSGDVYPTWFNDTLVNVGTIPPKGHVNVTVSVTFSNATGAKMHFDACGSRTSPPPPTKWCRITHTPLSEDSTVLFWPPPTYTLTITSTAGGTTDPSLGAHVYPNCTNVQVTATPDACYQFDHWELDSAWNYSTPITVHMDTDHTLHAVFTQINYTLTVNIVGSGSVSKNPDWASYACGTQVTLTATPDPCWTFSGWSGHASGTNPQVTITMDGDKTVTATFTQINYTLTVNIVGSGSVSKNPDWASYACGTQVTLTATPDPCWTFSGWSGHASGTNPQVTITMDGDKTVTATFTQEEYTLTVNVVGSGSVTKNPDLATYPCNTIVTLTAVPDAGWRFSGWSGDATGTASQITITMDGDKSVTATFIKEKPPVGGHAAPIDIATGKEVPHLLASQIGLAFALLAAMAVTILLTKRRSKTLK